MLNAGAGLIIWIIGIQLEERKTGIIRKVRLVFSLQETVQNFSNKTDKHLLIRDEVKPSEQANMIFNSSVSEQEPEV